MQRTYEITLVNSRTKLQEDFTVIAEVEDKGDAVTLVSVENVDGVEMLGIMEMDGSDAMVYNKLYPKIAEDIAGMAEDYADALEDR